MEYRIVHKLFKNPWVKTTLMFLFLLQNTTVICSACLTGECNKKDAMQIASGEQHCNGAMPHQTGHSMKSDTESKSADSSKETCPACQCQITGAVEGQDNFTLTSLTSVPILFVGEISHGVDNSMNLRSRPSPDPPQQRVRANPIFVLNSSFRL